MTGPLADGAAFPMMYRQGTILEWNVITLENVVQVGGTALVNLPVLGVAEADSYSPGDAVGIMVAGSTRAIIGRLVIPGSAAADEATALLSRRTVTDSIATQEGTTTTTYTDLATVGPTATVTVRNTGRLEVAVGCQIQRAAGNPWGGAMTVEMSGANVKTADTVAVELQTRWWQSLLSSGGITTTHTTQIFVYASATFEGLTPGETTLVAKYKAIDPAGTNVDFGRRSLKVTVL